MPKKKNKPQPMPVLRKCDCWLGRLEEDEMTCYCDVDCLSSVRYSVVDSKKVVHSRWGTINEALDDGRSRMDGVFTIYDNLEKKEVISYGEQ